MGDNPAIRCPSCAKSLGGLTREGDVRLRLAITLVKSDGTVHGPCPHCHADVVVTRGGTAEATIAKALAPASPSRLVLALRDLGG